MTIGFTFFVTWFVFKKVNGLIAIRRVEFIDNNADFISEVRQEYAEKEEGRMLQREGTEFQHV